MTTAMRQEAAQALGRDQHGDGAFSASAYESGSSQEAGRQGMQTDMSGNEKSRDELVQHGHGHSLPRYRTDGTVIEKTKGIAYHGESGRSGFHLMPFLTITFKSSSRVSMAVNYLWPVVPVAIGLFWAYFPDYEEQYLIVFIFNYIAMVPSANMVGFAGEELARKLPHTLGVITETTLGSLVELILLIILISSNVEIQVIRSAILGSILANLLFCLGLCFSLGGFLRDEQNFHEAVSEVGSGLLLVAGFGLIVPAAFASVLSGGSTEFADTSAEICNDVLKISRGTAVALLAAFCIYVYFQTTSHKGIYEEIIAADEANSSEAHTDATKKKLTLTECCVALTISMSCVALIAYALVKHIDPIVEQRHVTEAFMGLILVPLVEKIAEHLSAIDNAWENKPNVALTHVLGASIQTALLNTPIIVFIGWGLGKEMDLNFQTFESVILILSIIVVGSFLRDGSSNYLEGNLCIIVYVIIALCAYYYPNLTSTHSACSSQQEGRAREQAARDAEIAAQVVKALAAHGVSAVRSEL